MGIRDKLNPEESIISDNNPYYVTSQRLIYYQENESGEQFSEIPYSRIESVEIVRSPRHKLMIAGTMLILGGAIMAASMQFITSWPAIFAGIVALIFGGIGRESHYQIHAREMTKLETNIWRLAYWGNGSFVKTVRTIIGEEREY